MYFKFAWRYFKAKKSANAINIIAWVTTMVIAFATCCQILVLSVFNGFEDLVKSLYSSFYSDLKIIPARGKTFVLEPKDLAALGNRQDVRGWAPVLEEKALLKNGDGQTVVNLKGVDSSFLKYSGVPPKTIEGDFNTGTIDEPGIVVGYGIQNAVYLFLNNTGAMVLPTLILPKRTNSPDPLEALSEGHVETNGVFAIQQDFDNTYAFTNLDFLRWQMNYDSLEYSYVEVYLQPGRPLEAIQSSLEKELPAKFQVQSRYQQNMNLYTTMRMEKWIIFAVLTLILIIAAFNMISALTMLVLEKKQDISILQSMGSGRQTILKIFLAEGMLLGIIGGAIGIALALLICFLQINYKIIKLQGGSFLIDYFPVKVLPGDVLLVALTAIVISFIASWFPAKKAAGQPLELK